MLKTMARWAILLLAALGSMALAVRADDQEGPGLVLLGLPYGFGALEPVVDEETMQLHWGRHHKAYTDNANLALRGLAKDQGASPRLRQVASVALKTPNEAVLEEAIKLAIEEEPKASTPGTKKLLRSLRNNGGGFTNHNDFWKNLAPPSQGGGADPTGPLADALTKRFGSINSFREQFVAEGLAVFGSGWVWLVVTPQGKLEIITTPNQDRPIDGSHVVIACDVWEHAYYLKYQNKRQEYLSKIWSVINFKVAEERYENAMRECQESK